MTQSCAILKALQSGRTLTALDAFTDPAIRSMRLAARIEELRKAGHTIESVSIETPSGKRVAGYRLVKAVEPNGQLIFA